MDSFFLFRYMELLHKILEIFQLYPVRVIELHPYFIFRQRLAIKIYFYYK
jgi:hypothetical protein